MRRLHCAGLPNIRTLKKYITHINHAGFRIPVARWNEEVKRAMAIPIGTKILIPYNGRIGVLVGREFEFDRISLPRGRRTRQMVSGYTLLVSDGIDTWNVFRVPLAERI